MEGVLFVVIALGFLVVSGLVAYGNYLNAQKRRQGMQALATERGWSYAAEDPRWTTAYAGAPFGIGFGEEALNVVGGKHDGRRFIAFDYHYKTREGSGKSRRTVRHAYSIVAISTTAVLPDLAVTPEGWFGRMVGRITGTDIDLESEDFNRAFTVTCDERKFAVDVLHPRMMELLLAHPDLGWSLRSGSLVMATEGDHDLRVLDGKLAFIDRVLDEFPEMVWKQYGVQDPGAGTT